MKPPLLVYIVPLICGLFCWSCGGSTPVKRYYTLDNRRPPTVEISKSPACSLPLVIASVMAASPYEKEKIVFRTDRYEVRYYNYRFWVSSPEEMLKSLLLQKLDQSRLFPAVETYIHSASDHLAMYVKLNRIEELDADRNWNGRMAMEFLLKSSTSDDVLWRHGFDVTKVAKDKDTISLIEVLSEIYNEETDKMIRALATFLQNATICQP